MLTPLGKYYVVDAGYPNRDEYLAPYKGQLYHVPEWRNDPPPNGSLEGEAWEVSHKSNDLHEGKAHGFK